jgi:hypothetical protein
MTALQAIRDAWRWVRGEPPPISAGDEHAAEPVREWLKREEQASRDYLENVLVYRRERGG